METFESGILVPAKASDCEVCRGSSYEMFDTCEKRKCSIEGSEANIKELKETQELNTDKCYLTKIFKFSDFVDFVFFHLYASSPHANQYLGADISISMNQ